MSDLITLDFESYYARGYDLRSMTMIEYITDERFKAHGVGLKINDAPAYFCTEDEIEDALNDIDWSNAILLCQNTLFDAAILAWHYGHTPLRYADTRCMSLGIWPHASASLKYLAERLWPNNPIMRKGEEISNFKDRLDLTNEEVQMLEKYCKQDVELTYAAFQKMMPHYPDKEMQLIDHTIRMFVEPKLRLNVKQLKRIQVQEIMDRNRTVVESGYTKTQLSSNKQFAEILINDFGITPPMKISPATGKETFAFGKTDSGFQDLLEIPDPKLQAVLAARIVAKSTQTVTRTGRFILIGERLDGLLPVPLQYYGAHTGRYAGQDKINLQNLERGSDLRKCIEAPEGYMLMTGDSSAIEARMLCWLAGEDRVLDDYRSGADVYCILASKIFGRPIGEDDKDERFVGKVARLGLGYGMGVDKFLLTIEMLSTKMIGKRMILPREIGVKTVNTFRDENSRIVALWSMLNDLLFSMMDEKCDIEYKGLRFQHERVLLPNGMYLHYPQLQYNHLTQEILYEGRNGFIRIYGGSFCENIVQALSRILVIDQLMEVHQRYPMLFTVHDEGNHLVPESESETAVALMTEVMSKTPEWCKDLPVKGDVKIARNYSK